MRSTLLLTVTAVGLTAFVSGCTYYVQEREPRNESYASRASEPTGPSSATWNSDEPEEASTTETSGAPPAHPPKQVGRFEVVASLVLQSIPYKDCGVGGKGDIDITFAPSGAVEKIVIYADGWKDSTKECVSERFAVAHVMPFMGDSRTVRWHAELGDGGGWGA
jgi:hypothetical protein